MNFTLNFTAVLKYIIHSVGYGIVVAVALLLLMPELREGNESWWNILQSSEQNSQPLSYAKAVRSASPAVVNIYSEEIQNTPSFNRIRQNTTRLGSGVIMESSGYILTNYHVVQNATLILIWLQNSQRFPAELIGYDIYTDLAVLKVNASNLPVIPQAQNQESYVGDIVLAIGNPLNLGQTVTQGIISATGRNGLSNTSHLEFLQMDAAINNGNSGGALVNSNGQLVGINSRKFNKLIPQMNDVQGIFFAVPYKLAYKVMQKIIETGRVTRGWLGIISNNYSDRFKGFIIESVTINSPADKAGIEAGDIIYQIGTTPIRSITHALDIIAETTPGTQLTFKIYRNNTPLDLPVTIIELSQL